MNGKSEFRKAIQKRLAGKADRPQLIPGLLGAYVAGSWTVKVPGRNPFCYVRVHGSNSEVVQAFNDSVSPILGLAVVLTRDELTPSYYRVLRRDLPKYPTWNESQLGYHAIQHQFGGTGSAGRDVVWVQKQQFVPLEVRPTAATGSYQCWVDGDYYQFGGAYKYFSGSATPDLSVLRPAAVNQGLFALVYLDGNTDSLKIATGSVFTHTPWPNSFRTYIPTIDPGTGLPLAGILVTHEMSGIYWNQIYDIRSILGNGFVTGTGDMLRSLYDPNYDGIIGIAQGGTNAATASGARTNLGLGNSAVLDVGSTTGTVALGDDCRFGNNIMSRRYCQMPTQIELQNDMDVDYAAGVSRKYILPSGNLILSTDLTFNPGQEISGQGWESSGYGTQITMTGTSSRIVMGYQTTLENVCIEQSSTTTGSAVYAYQGAADLNATSICLRNILFGGGNINGWGIHFQNPYEYYFENLKFITHCNGIKIEATNDHPYNPGDGTAIKVQIRLQEANTKALHIRGQTAGGAYSTRHPNNQTWVGLYTTGADKASWISSNMMGVEIVNTSRLHFYGANLEECSPCLKIDGSVDGGPSLAAISFSDSWISGDTDDIQIGSGVADVEFIGCRLDHTPTGAGAANCLLIGTNVGWGSGVPVVLSPHFRGELNTKKITQEIYVTNGHSTSIPGFRAAKWDSGGYIVPMTSSDEIADFAGILFTAIGTGSSGFIVAKGITTAFVSGSVSIGDYVGLAKTDDGRLVGLGSSFDVIDVPVLGMALSSGLNSNLTVKIEPHQPAPQQPYFGITGQYYSSGLTWTTAAQTANTLSAAPYYLPKTTRIDQMAIEITTPATGTFMRIGIYNDNGYGYPGTLRLDAGRLDATTAAVVTTGVSLTLTPGLYWLAAVAQGSSPTCRVINSPSIPIGYNALSASSHSGYVHTGVVNGALPSAFSGLVNSSGGVPRVAIRPAPP